MNPLRKEQKTSILERVNFIEIELKDLNNYQGIERAAFFSQRDLRRNVERIAENIANACIDISKILLAGEMVEMPNTYQEVILKLGEIGLIDRSLADKIAKIARIRNILAHQYLDIEWEMIKDFIAEAPIAIPKFIDPLKS